MQVDGTGLLSVHQGGINVVAGGAVVNVGGITSNSALTVSSGGVAVTGPSSVRPSLRLACFLHCMSSTSNEYSYCNPHPYVAARAPFVTKTSSTGCRWWKMKRERSPAPLAVQCTGCAEVVTIPTSFWGEISLRGERAGRATSANHFVFIFHTQLNFD